MVVGAEADSSSGPRMERMTGRRMRPCQRPNTTVSKNTCTQKHHPQQEYMDKTTPPSARIPAQKNTTLSKNTCTQKHHPQQEYLHTKTPPSARIPAHKNTTLSKNICTKKTTPLARIPAHKTHHHQQEDLHGSQHLPLEGIPKLHGAQITQATGIPAQFTKNHSLQENLHSAQTPQS